MLSDKRIADFDRHIEAPQTVRPRILLELLREMGADTPCMTAAKAVVTPYPALDLVLVRAIDADRFLACPWCLLLGARP
jgi:hypothetical protein